MEAPIKTTKVRTGEVSRFTAAPSTTQVSASASPRLKARVRRA
jgi:hypothetical protein